MVMIIYGTENVIYGAENEALALVLSEPGEAVVTVVDKALPAPSLLELLLGDKRSEATRRAYKTDMAAFFGASPTPEQLRAFASLPAPQLALRLTQYKAQMLERKLSEATINRRLAALRSLLKLAYRVGVAETDGRGLVDGEKVKAYRDTRGVDAKTLKALVALPGTDTLRGKRDTVLLRLMAENALRRAEVCALNVADFEEKERRLQILGKGRGSQKMPITLSVRCVETLVTYLNAGGHREDAANALFRNVDHRPKQKGGRLTPKGLYWLIQDYGKRMELALTPHKLRHSAITAALDATGGDVRRVQKLSRHADLRTLTIYDDNRTDMQGEVTDLLSGLL
jgi:integrase/recombinase XerC